MHDPSDEPWGLEDMRRARRAVLEALGDGARMPEAALMRTIRHCVHNGTLSDHERLLGDVLDFLREEGRIVRSIDTITAKFWALNENVE
jgi:hypothetical protein